MNLGKSKSNFERRIQALTLLLPFVEVLLHTYMETLNEEEDRTINHHGVAMTVGGEEKDKEKKVDRLSSL